VGEQALFTQAVEPFVFEQVNPHDPQLVTVFVRLVSQPLFLLLSQLPKPPLQMGVHAPAAHEVVPLVFVQIVPQAPQLVVLVWVLVSQPLFTFASQLAKPELHTGTQTPAGQVVVPLRLVHTVVHVPQCAVLFRVASHPSVRASLLQLPHVPRHEIVQAPSEQPGVPLLPLQAWLQAPQCPVFVCVLISQPLLARPSQFEYPLLQVVIWQVPVAHEVVAFAAEQPVPHPPQLVFVFSAVSHPFAMLPSQLPYPGAHVVEHTPFTHDAVP
jgi:hypothetical protein